jgi:hypothetical protein
VAHAHPYAGALSAYAVRIDGVDIPPDAVVWLADELVAAGHGAAAARLLEASLDCPETVRPKPKDADAILEVLTILPALTNPPEALVELRLKLRERVGGVLEGR